MYKPTHTHTHPHTLVVTSCATSQTCTIHSEPFAVMLRGSKVRLMHLLLGVIQPSCRSVLGTQHVGNLSDSSLARPTSACSLKPATGAARLKRDVARGCDGCSRARARGTVVKGHRGSWGFLFLPSDSCGFAAFDSRAFTRLLT